MKLTTTLNKIRAYSPCTSGWEKLLSHLGTDFNLDAEINLLTVLESNGVADMLWTLRATEQDSKRIASQLAIEFAEQALPIFEERLPNDLRPRQAIQAARDYLDGTIDLAALRKAHAASYAAAASYTDADIADAAYAASYAAACYADADIADAAHYADASYAAACYADASYASYADAADAREKARQTQAEIIRMILEA